MIRNWDLTPSGEAARTAETAVHHSRNKGRLPASPRDYPLSIACPAGARLTEAGCKALQGRAARALAKNSWSDSMAWYCGHCDRAPGLEWKPSSLLLLVLAGLDLGGCEDPADPRHAHRVLEEN